MKPKTVLFSVAGTVLALALIDAGVAFISSRDSLAGPFDLSSVSAIRVEGSASDIRISTAASGPHVAELKGTRHGWGAIWHSGWFSDACPANGAMRIDGNTLIVDVGSRPRLFDWSDCTMELTAHLPSGAAVVVDQKAARTRLDGDFSVVDIRSDAGDVTVDGHADSLTIAGAALRARITYQRVMQNEAIAISGKMLDATLRFVQPTTISYLVEATASFVDSALPNTPGAKPSITIRGEMLRARIE
jgi:hypothetical protein